MLVYILKFSACLTIFLVFYKFFLERENMHHWKRFYLIGMVLASIIIPFITFTQYVDQQPVLDSFSATALSATDTVSPTEVPTNYVPIILWSVYGIGVLLFGLKFAFNLVQMIVKIKKNPKQKALSFINVLLTDLVAPHTFFSYIFLNKHQYETQQIPQEVLLHEQTHAVQKHSIDVLFIELLQVIFWFNPLIYFIKNSIKLNHEFLADKSVLNKGIKPSNYQQILLAFSTNQNEPALANAINYSSIKKRLTVMKTHTSKQKMWFRSLVLLPLMALTLYGFSDRIEIIKEKNQLELLQKTNDEIPAETTSQKVSQEQDGASREQMKEYNKLAKYYNTQPKNNMRIKSVDVERLKYIYSLMTEKQKKDAEPFPNFPPPPAPPPAPPVPKAKEPEQPRQVQELPPPPPPPIPDNATKEQKEKYKKVIEEYNRKYTVKNGRVSENPPPPPIPENATPEQRKKYEEATRLYKLRTEKNEFQRVKQQRSQEVQKLKQEKLASQEVRSAKLKTAKGELTRVKELKSQADVQKLKREKLAYKEARLAKIKTEKREHAQVKELRKEEAVLRLKQEKLAYAEAQRAKLSTDERLARVKEIQTPEPPKPPLDHVVDMAKKDAKFYLEGKEISSDQAIKALKENKHLNIQTLDSSSNQPKVYISKKPIVIDN